MNNSVEIKNVTKVINNKKIIDDISFNVQKGCILGLVGPNGAGKSTLLKIMTGLYTLDFGEIYYEGISLRNNFEKAMNKVGCIIETPDMYGNLTGKDNLDLFKVMFKGVNEDIIKGIVNILNLEKVIGKKVKTYSLGMKERLGIATSLLGSPKVLILDEPTNGLDPIGIKNLKMLLSKIKKNCAIIISSHMLNEIETLCDEVIFINDGKIIERKEINLDKKIIEFEVDDYSRAKLLVKNYSVGEGLSIYASDEEISNVNKTLILNNIKVYRIKEKKYSLEKDFFDKLGG